MCRTHFFYACLFSLGLSLFPSKSSAQTSVDMEFRVAVGEPANLVTSGTVWLYHYSYGHFDKYKLAALGGQAARLSLSLDDLREKVKAKYTSAYIIYFELPGPLFYRTDEISPATKTLFRDIPVMIKGMGNWIHNEKGGPLLVLPAYSERVIRFLTMDGKPVPNHNIPVSIYLFDNNHCAAHFGFALGKYVTDASGEINLKAPLVDLYLEETPFLTKLEKRNWAGQEYIIEYGFRIGSSLVEVIRKIWSLPEQEYAFTVHDATGIPLANISLEQYTRMNECGAAYGCSLAKSDGKGFIKANLIPQITERLVLKSKSGEERELSEDELKEMFEKGSLDVKW